MKSGNSAESADSQEKAFNRISSFIESLAIWFPGEFSIPVGKNNWNISTIDCRMRRFISVISPIHNQITMRFIIRGKAWQFSFFRSITCISALTRQIVLDFSPFASSEISYFVNVQTAIVRRLCPPATTGYMAYWRAFLADSRFSVRISIMRISSPSCGALPFV